METIKLILSSTPTWVYILLAYLIFIGIKSSKTNVVSIIKLAVIPIIFSVMSVETLTSSFNLSDLTVGIWAISIIVGAAIGFIQIYRLKLKVDRKNLLIKVPGTWSTLILVLIIFASKYYFGMELAMDPNFAHQSIFEFTMLAISGLFTGMFVGKLLCFIYRMKTNKSVNLKKA
jgi:hypothetical protein